MTFWTESAYIRRIFPFPCAISEVAVDSISLFDNYRNMKLRDGIVHSDIVIRALGALAQEHRLAAFRLLVQAGDEGMAAGAIAERLGVPASSMSFHLAQLGHAGLVTQRRASRSIIYAADYAAMDGLMGYLTENCCAGVPCTANIGCSPSVMAEKKTAA
jgi:ArsR family transcriptional regulator, arsenate/arsenite/antimonite-responsive transcriptional repressor